MILLFTILRQNKASSFYLSILLIFSISLSAILGSSAYYYARMYENISIVYIVSFYLFSVLSMAFGLTPTTFISIISGYILNWTSVFPLVISYMLASLIGYFTAKTIDKGKFLQSIKEKDNLSKVYIKMKKNEILAVFFTKISPVIPFAVGNFLLSIGNVRLIYFLLGSLVGMLPRTLLAIWTGIQLHSFLSGEGIRNNLSNWLILILILISIAGFYFIFTDKKKPEKSGS